MNKKTCTMTRFSLGSRLGILLIANRVTTTAMSMVVSRRRNNGTKKKFTVFLFDT